MILMNKKKDSFMRPMDGTSISGITKEILHLPNPSASFFLRNRMLFLFFISICDFAIFFYSQREPLPMGL